MDYKGRNRKKKSIRGISFGGKAVLIIVVVLLVSAAFAFFPVLLKDTGISQVVTRIKNVFAFTFLGAPPQFYYLDIEKNAEDIRIKAEDTFEITYRDEFVIKNVTTDVLSGKDIFVDIEGVGGDNDFRSLIKGIDIVDKIITSPRGAAGNKVYDYKIKVSYRNRPIAAIPMKINITAQDWLRYAKDSDKLHLRIKYLKRAISMNQTDINVQKMLAAVYVQAGMIDQAVAQYKAILSRKPDDLTSLEALVKCYMDRKDYDGVINTGLKLIKANRGDYAAHANIAFAYGQSGHWSKAISHYEEALKIDPGNAAVRFKLAEAYEKAKKEDAALDQYQLIIKKTPNDENALIYLAEASLKNAKYDEAIRWYREIIKKQPQNSSAYANLGLAYGKKGSVKEEIESYRKSISLNPKDPVVHYNLAVAYEKLKRLNDAVGEYRQVLKLRPADIDALERIANVHMENKQYAQAIDYYKKLLKQSPKKGAIHAHLGFAYAELKKYWPSADNYQNAIKYGFTSPDVYHNLAASYQKLGKTDKAISIYEKLAASKPTMDVYNVLVEQYIKLKKYDSAIGVYREMIKMEPKKASLYSGLAYVYLLDGETDKAIEQYKVSIRYDADDYYVHLNLGEAFEKKGMLKDALTAYTRAYELNPDSDRAARKIPQLKIKMLQQKHNAS